MKKDNHPPKARKFKRPFLLLEVLIAFLLIALCAIPLVAPHISMIKAQKELEAKVKINHAANMIYAHVLEKLHKSEIPLNIIEEQKSLPVEEAFLQGILGYKAEFRFIKKKVKGRNADGFKTYYSILQVRFSPTGNRISQVFETDIFLASKRPPGAEEASNGDGDDEESEAEESEEV